MNNYISEFKLYEIFRILMPGTYTVVMLFSVFDCYMPQGNDTILVSLMMFILAVFFGSIFYAADLCRIYNITTTWKWSNKTPDIIKLKFLPTNLMRSLLFENKEILQRDLEHKYYNWYHFSDTKTRTELQSGLYHLFTNFLFASLIIFVLNKFINDFKDVNMISLYVMVLSILGVLLIYNMRLKHSWERNFAQYVNDKHPDLKYDFKTNKVIKRSNAMSNNLNEYFDKVLSEFTLNITDRVFLMIEKNEELYLEYMRWVKEKGKDQVNRDLGLEVKEYFELENLEENKNPKSKLIKSYTEHKRTSKAN